MLTITLMVAVLAFIAACYAIILADKLRMSEGYWDRGSERSLEARDAVRVLKSDYNRLIEFLGLTKNQKGEYILKEHIIQKLPIAEAEKSVIRNIREGHAIQALGMVSKLADDVDKDIEKLSGASNIERVTIPLSGPFKNVYLQRASKKSSNKSKSRKVKAKKGKK